MPTIACVFRQTLPLGGMPGSLLAALQAYVSEDVAPAWGRSATLVVRNEPQPGEWALYFLDAADQAGELGRHESGAVPFGYVFLGPAADEGKSISEPASHELAEMIADPWCNLAALSPRGRFVAMEIADPVEGEVYDRSGWPVSNFVFPAWFGQGPGPFDKLGTCQQAWEVRLGGYISTFQDGQWSSLFGSERAELDHACTDKRLRRWARRRKEERRR